MAPAVVMEREAEVQMTEEVRDLLWLTETTEGRATLSREPFPDGTRPRYYNPVYPGCEMRWGATENNDLGFKQTIQKERWTEMFEPRNPYEEAMTRAWMVQNLPGCQDPDRWKGDDHPDGGRYLCQCNFSTGNHAAFTDHRKRYQHQEVLPD